MKWDLFSREGGGRGGGPDERIDRLIKDIERFAPRRYRSFREIYYYNYRIQPAYVNPLLELLFLLSERKRLKSEGEDFTRAVFLKLKKFYDPRDRLSQEEALRDKTFRKKFRELFLYFHGIKDQTLPAAPNGG